MLPLTRPADPSEIPVIDLREFRFADAAEREEVVAQIRSVARQAGFFYITGHGIPAARIDGMFDAARAFFALPEEAKLETSIKKSGWDFNGYLPPAHKGEDSNLKADLHEAFQVRVQLPADDPLKQTPLYGPNPWPRLMPGLEALVEDYQTLLSALSRKMLGLFAEAMGLPADGLDRFFEKPTSLLRLLHYPAQAPDENDEAIGTRAHTDTGAFTILSQDEVGGLEVLLKTGEWVTAPPKKYHYVINLGEMMRGWTDGMFAATPHRVINRYGAERFSVPFFFNPSYEAPFDPVIHNEQGTNSNFEGLISKQAYRCYGDWILDAYSRIYNKPDGPMPLRFGTATSANA